MDTEVINIRVDAETAKTFKSLPEEDRRKIEALLSIRLNGLQYLAIAAGGGAVAGTQVSLTPEADMAGGNNATLRACAAAVIRASCPCRIRRWDAGSDS